MSYLSYAKPFNNNLLMLLLRDHKRYMPIVEFFQSMTMNLSEISWLEAELIATEISKANRSDFCTGMREGMTKAMKASPEALKDDKLTAALTFAHKVNQKPSDVSQEDVDCVIKAGWNEQTVEDIVGLVAIQALYNIISTGLGFKSLSEAAFAEIGQDTVNNGYVGSFQHFINMPGI